MDSRIEKPTDQGIGVRAAPVSKWRAVARHDPLAERIRQQILLLMDANGKMEQRELARRAKEPYPRVHKFVKGQMPYPPLSFLDRLLRVFGYTLPEALAQTVLPVKPAAPPAFSRLLVLEIALVIDGWPDESLKDLKTFVQGFQPKKRRR